MSAVHELQRRFQCAVLAEDPLPGMFVEEDSSTKGGFGLYLAAYRARLAAALRDNFTVLHRALGDEAFADLARAYIDQNPSNFRSIRWFGNALPAFLDANPAQLSHPALADIARMDWAMRGAFDAAGTPLLTLHEVAAMALEAWPQRRFKPIPSLRIVDLAWNVEPIWRALNDDAGAKTDAPVPWPHELLVWRPKLDCLWRSATQPEVAALRSLLQGATFAECCAAIAASGSVDPAVTAVGLLHCWVADGLLENVA